MQKILFLGLATTAIASPAFADLTAEQVLSDQLSFLTVDGFIKAETTGTRPNGNSLIVDGYVLHLTDEDGSEATMTLGGVEILERSDGTVEIIYPDTFPITVESAEMTDESQIETLFWSVNFQNMSHIVSGDPGNITHAISFESAELGEIRTTPAGVLPATLEYGFAITDTDATIRLSDLAPMRRDVSVTMGRFILDMALPTVAESDAFGEVTELDAQIEMLGLDGSFRFADTPIPEHALDLKFDRFSWRQDMAGDELDSFDLDISADDFALGYEAALSLEAFDDDFAQAMASDQRVSGRTSYGAMSMSMSADAPEGDFRTLSSAGTTNAEFSLDKTGFFLSLISASNDAVISLPIMPDFPLQEFSYGFGLSEVEMAIPFDAVAAPKPVRLKYMIRDIVMAEDIWSLFDPEGRLPRDPANIIIDIDGQVQQSQNLLEIDPGETPTGTFDGRLNAFDINLAGAELTATGSADMDVEGDETPTGTARLDARITGFNTLLDTLIDMGLLPSEQAMGARMMLGVVARQIEGQDTLTSTIEVREDGSIHANGQRLR